MLEVRQEFVSGETCSPSVSSSGLDHWLDLVLDLSLVITSHLRIGGRRICLLTSLRWCHGFVTSMIFFPLLLRVGR